MTPIDSRDLKDYNRHLRHLRFKQNLRNLLRILPIVGQYLAFALVPQTRPIPDAESFIQPLLLRNHIVIIATFPFAFSLMLIRNPLMVSYLVNIAPIALVLGVAGLWLAQRRGIPVEKQFLNLVWIGVGIATILSIPFWAAGFVSHNLYSLMAASLLYGASLAIFLMLSLGLYGLTVNFQKPQREIAGA
jgi:predicted neutral ceramidase superfamily lipid hydrolase